MAEVVYVLCALTSVACAVLLLRSYFRSRLPLILWTSACFVGLAVNNVILVIDLVVLPTSVTLALWRNGSALAAVTLLLFGLIVEDW